MPDTERRKKKSKAQKQYQRNLYFPPFPLPLSYASLKNGGGKGEEGEEDRKASISKCPAQTFF
jgi:hypothetical protein